MLRTASEGLCDESTNGWGFMRASSKTMTRRNGRDIGRDREERLMRLAECETSRSRRRRSPRRWIGVVAADRSVKSPVHRRRARRLHAATALHTEVFDCGCSTWRSGTPGAPLSVARHSEHGSLHATPHARRVVEFGCRTLDRDWWRHLQQRPHGGGQYFFGPKVNAGADPAESSSRPC